MPILQLMYQIVILSKLGTHLRRGYPFSILFKFLILNCNKLHPPKVWERFADDVYYRLKRTHLQNFSHHMNNLHQNIKFTLEEECIGELPLLDTLLKLNNEKISVLVYRKPTNTDQ